MNSRSNGDLCAHPGSPVNRGSYRHYQKGECGPVCIGELKCQVPMLHSYIEMGADTDTRSVSHRRESPSRPRHRRHVQ